MASSKNESGKFHTVYLYYLYGDAEEVKHRIYEWFDPKKPVLSVEDRISHLAMNALVDGDDPPCYSIDPTHVQWRRKGYIAFVVDIPGYSYDPTALKISGRHFDGKPGKPEKTFKGFTNYQITIGQRLLQVFYFQNLMKNYNDTDLVNYEWEEYIFELPYMLSGLRVPDSGGTNMGPPVPPPA